MPNPVEPFVVAPQDELTCEIKLTGMFGFDLETVAGRETAREKMIEAATRQIGHWLDAVRVTPNGRSS